MNFSRISLGLLVIIVTCLQFGNALRCLSCDSKSSCRRPTKIDCTPQNANLTRSYLDLHYVGVNMSQTFNQYTCIRDDLNTHSGEFLYRGCMYNNRQYCVDLRVRDYHAAFKYERKCTQCNHKDLCNPAGRATFNMINMVTVIIVAICGKHFLL